MKKLVLLLAATAAYFAFRRLSSHTASPAPLPAPAPVDQLAHRLQDAWADHHTVA